MAKHELVNQPTAKPTAKVLAALTTGAGATLALGIISAASDAVPAGTFWGGLVAYVLTGAAGYIKRARATGN